MCVYKFGCFNINTRLLIFWRKTLIAGFELLGPKFKCVIYTFFNAIIDDFVWDFQHIYLIRRVKGVVNRGLPA